MNVLEKILEEIKEVEKKFVAGHKVLFALGATGMVTEIEENIRSHMDEVPNCGECNRRKWYQIGDEDGKKDKDWISVEDRLPEDDDMRFYMCIVENHEEDLPMFCQYDSEYGFGFWDDIYDSTSLGFVDTVFKTNDELGYEKVVAWQPLPEPMRKE